MGSSTCTWADALAILPSPFCTSLCCLASPDRSLTVGWNNELRVRVNNEERVLNPNEQVQPKGPISQQQVAPQPLELALPPAQTPLTGAACALLAGAQGQRGDAALAALGAADDADAARAPPPDARLAP